MTTLLTAPAPEAMTMEKANLLRAYALRFGAKTKTIRTSLTANWHAIVKYLSSSTLKTLITDLVNKPKGLLSRGGKAATKVATSPMAVVLVTWTVAEESFETRVVPTLDKGVRFVGRAAKKTVTLPVTILDKGVEATSTMLSWVDSKPVDDDSLSVQFDRFGARVVRKLMSIVNGTCAYVAREYATIQASFGDEFVLYLLRKAALVAMWVQTGLAICGLIKFVWIPLAVVAALYLGMASVSWMIRRFAAPLTDPTVVTPEAVIHPVIVELVTETVVEAPVVDEAKVAADAIMKDINSRHGSNPNKARNYSRNKR